MQTNDGQSTNKPKLPILSPLCSECGKPMHARATMLTPHDISYVCIVCAWQQKKSPRKTLQG